MGKRQTIIRSLFTGILTLGLLAFAPLAQATTVTDVCNTLGNSCSNGIASINVKTTVTCPFIAFGQDETVLDFVAAGFPFVQINTGATLKAEDIPRCSLTLIVGDLLVKLGGKLNVDKKTNNTPGTVKVIASDTIRVDKGGRITAIGGKQTDAHPTIDLLAINDISIAGILEARGLSAIGNGGQIFIESTAGLITVEGTAKVLAKSTDPGGTLIRITACLGIEIFGTVDATSKKRTAVLELFSREGILIDGGKVIADIKIGELAPGDVHTLTMQARGDIIVRSRLALISASTKTTNKQGGMISAISTEGSFRCEDGKIKADSISGGSDGGTIFIQSLNDVLYDCDITAKGSNANNGVGGVVALQSFQQDVRGAGNIDVSARNQGNILLTACEDPLTAGGSFSTFPVLMGGQCINSPLTIEPCVLTQTDVCIDLEKEISVDGGATFADADIAVLAPSVSVPSDALYRLTVENCGQEDLVNVIVNDPTLIIVNFGIGSLLVGQQVILTEGEIAQLSVQDRCDSTGTFTNVAEVTGESFVDGQQVTDTDPAILICESGPAIELEKQISVDGGATFLDADDAGSAPSVAPLSDALYRLIVRNIGGEDLVNVTINDPTLGIVNFAIGTLLVGEEVILTEGEIVQLSVQERCDTAGAFTNIATVAGNSIKDFDQVSDTDSAVLVCEGDPAIELKKQISVDGGVTFLDADDAGSAPSVVPLSDGLYRLIATNIGGEALVNVEINDPELGIVNFSIGSLAVGEEVILTEGEIAQLSVQERCDTAGAFTNVAEVTGESVVDGEQVTDTDPAVLVCEDKPDIEVEKQISVDGGATFFDADDAGSAPNAVPLSDALYRLIVRNTGSEDLVNVVINDPTLNIVSFIVGNLAIGQEVILTEGEIPELEVQERCGNAGTFTNVATVTGDSVVDGDQVTGTDPAVLVCDGVPPCIDIIKKVNGKDANTCPGKIVKPGQKLKYIYLVKNCGQVDLEDIIVDDDILGPVGTIDLLRPNRRKTLMLMTFAPDNPDGGAGDDDDDDGTGDDDDDDDGTGDDDDDDGTGDDDDDDGTGDDDDDDDTGDDDDDDGGERIKNIATATGFPVGGGDPVTDDDPACVTVDFPEPPPGAGDDDDDDDDGTGDDDDDD